MSLKAFRGRRSFTDDRKEGLTRKIATLLLGRRSAPSKTAPGSFESVVAVKPQSDRPRLKRSHSCNTASRGTTAESLITPLSPSSRSWESFLPGQADCADTPACHYSDQLLTDVLDMVWKAEQALWRPPDELQTHIQASSESAQYFENLRGALSDIKRSLAEAQDASTAASSAFSPSSQSLSGCLGGVRTASCGVQTDEASELMPCECMFCEAPGSVKAPGRATPQGSSADCSASWLSSTASEKNLFDGAVAHASAFQTTPPVSITFAVEQAMRHLNVPRVAANTCCPFHASLDCTWWAYKKLSKKQCQPLWSCYTGWQCKLCLGVNDTKFSLCEICSSERPPANESEETEVVSPEDWSESDRYSDSEDSQTASVW